MGSRATRPLKLLALRCFRPQFHYGLERQPHISQHSLAGLSSSSSVKAEDYGGPQAGIFLTKLLELEASRFESAEKLPMTDPISRRLLSLLPWQDRSKTEWTMNMVDERLSSGIQRGEHYQASASFTHQDFLSRYLQWRRYDQFTHSLKSEISYISCVVNVNGFLRETSSNTSFSRFFSSPSSFLHHSMIIPLEADSVKRKRKKKMNKHKQRKLRRRDRHRN